LRLRLVLRLPGTYEGAVTTPNAEWDVRADVDDHGDVTVHTRARAELSDYTRRVVRIAARHARDEGMPLPRMIQRWRADQPER
jgi:hypothetical protein